MHVSILDVALQHRAHDDGQIFSFELWLHFSIWAKHRLTLVSVWQPHCVRQLCVGVCSVGAVEKLLMRNVCAVTAAAVAKSTFRFMWDFYKIFVGGEQKINVTKIVLGGMCCIALRWSVCWHRCASVTCLNILSHTKLTGSAADRFLRFLISPGMIFSMENCQKLDGTSSNPIEKRASLHERLERKVVFSIEPSILCGRLCGKWLYRIYLPSVFPADVKIVVITTQNQHHHRTRPAK